MFESNTSAPETPPASHGAAEPAAAPAGEQSSAGPTLGDLTSQFDDALPNITPEQASAELDRQRVREEGERLIDEAVDRRWQERLAQAETEQQSLNKEWERSEQDLAERNALVGAIKSHPSLGTFNDETVSRLLEGVASSEPGLREAFDNRFAQPVGWQQAASWAVGEVTRMLTSVTDAAERHAWQVRTDIEAAAASMRNQRADYPAAPRHNPVELFNMSDRDYSILKQKLLAEGRR